jgi:hypothetical protein
MMEKKFYVIGTVSETEGTNLYSCHGSYLFHMTEAEAKDSLEYCQGQEGGEEDKLYEVTFKEVL